MTTPILILPPSTLCVIWKEYDQGCKPFLWVCSWNAAMMLRMVNPLASSGLWKCRYVDPCSAASAAVFKKWGIPRCPTTVPGEETYSPGPQAPATRWEQKEHIHRSQILTDCGRKVLERCFLKKTSRDYHILRQIMAYWWFNHGQWWLIMGLSLDYHWIILGLSLDYHWIIIGLSLDYHGYYDG